MWIKIVICIALIAFSTSIGYLLSGKYRARRKLYDQFSLFNERYLNELNYARKPLPDFLKQYEYTGDFAKTIKQCVEKRDCNVKLSFLTVEERSACGNYFSMLGKGDALSQRSFFGAQTGALEEKRADSEKKAKSRGGLYLKLGLLAGLAIVILII